MTAPLLSVVVPFYGVERYFKACLESLQRQSLTDFEAVLVDDGSLDSSLEIAQTFCAGDARFRVVRQENQGLGPARNTGVAAAQGRFLAFVDSDDLVPRHAYERMVGSLLETGSDLAAGHARRFSEMGTRISWAHRIPFATERLATRIAEFPELALDRMAWNKVVDRRFWDAHGFAFPAMLYEDYPVTIRQHVLAAAVDVLPDPVYYWRERDGGEPSITQRKWELSNLRDRVASAEMVLDIVAPTTQPIVDQVAAHLLHIDVAAIAAALHQVEPDEAGEVLTLARRLTARIPAHVRDAAIPFDRVQAHLIESGRLDQLKELIDYRSENGVDAPVVRTGRFKRRFALSLPGQGRGEVPASAFEVGEDATRLVARILDSHWAGGRLHLDLNAYAALLPMTEDSRVEVWLEGPHGRRVTCHTTRYVASHPHIAPDRSGVRVVIDPAHLDGADARAGTFWLMKVKVVTQGVTRVGIVGSVAPGRARWPSYEPVRPRLWAQPQIRTEGFGVWFRTAGAVVTGAVTLHDRIELVGDLGPDTPREPLALRFVRAKTEEIVFPAEEVEPEGGRRRFRAVVPVHGLIGHGDHDDPVEERTVWIPRLLVGDKELIVAVDKRYSGAFAFVGTRRVEAGRTGHGNLALTESHGFPGVTDALWEGRTLVLRGQLAEDVVSGSAVALRFLTPLDPVEVRPALTIDRGLFEVRVDVDELRARAREHPIEGGAPVAGTPWHLFLELGGLRTRITMARALVWRLPAPRSVGGTPVTVQVDHNEVVQVLVP